MSFQRSSGKASSSRVIQTGPQIVPDADLSRSRRSYSSANLIIDADGRDWAAPGSPGRGEMPALCRAALARNWTRAQRCRSSALASSPQWQRSASQLRSPGSSHSATLPRAASRSGSVAAGGSCGMSTLCQIRNCPPGLVGASRQIQGQAASHRQIAGRRSPRPPPKSRARSPPAPVSARHGPPQDRDPPIALDPDRLPGRDLDQDAAECSDQVAGPVVGGPPNGDQGQIVQRPARVVA
jgi:hypothetical protein